MPKNPTEPLLPPRLAGAIAKATDQAATRAWLHDDAPDPGAAAPVAMKRLTIDIPKSLHQKLRQYALDQDEPMADILRRLIEDLVR